MPVGVMDALLESMHSRANFSRKSRENRMASLAALKQQQVETIANSSDQGITNPITSGGAKYGGGNVDNWIKQAMGVLGVNLDNQRLNALKTIIQKESGGNPKAINNWDSNAKRGTPSQGLMQTIPGTFNAYKLKGYDNITDPIANIIAGYRYATKRYGDILKVPGIKSMSKGGAYRGY